jgi:hypothetical protein
VQRVRQVLQAQAVLEQPQEVRMRQSSLLLLRPVPLPGEAKESPDQTHEDAREAPQEQRAGLTR